MGSNSKDFAGIASGSWGFTRRYSVSESNRVSVKKKAISPVVEVADVEIDIPGSVAELMAHVSQWKEARQRVQTEADAIEELRGRLSMVGMNIALVDFDREAGTRTRVGAVTPPVPAGAKLEEVVEGDDETPSDQPPVERDTRPATEIRAEALAVPTKPGADQAFWQQMEGGLQGAIAEGMREAERQRDQGSAGGFPGL